MRHFCQYGLCCDRIRCGHAVRDNDEFIGVIWLCEHHAARNRASALNLDVPLTTFERFASSLPSRKPISREHVDALLGFIKGVGEP